MSPLRIALLGEPGGWHVGRLAEAFRGRGHGVALVRWTEVTAGVDATGEWFAPVPLAMADAVVVRGMPGVSTTTDRLEEVIFRMDAVGRIAAHGVPVVNPPRALEIAIDKFLSLSILSAAGIAVPRTTVVQNSAAAIDAWRNLGCDCVAKPIFGSRGRGLSRITDEAAAAGLVPATGGIAYVQEFIPHAGWDVRALVIGTTIHAMRRVATAGDWRTNISRGGRPEPCRLPADWADVAIRAAEAAGAPVAGVDIVPAADGRPVVLELNGVPAWRGLQTVTDTDIAGEIADFIERRARRRLEPAGS